MKTLDPKQVTMNGIRVMSPNEWNERSPFNLLKRIVTVGGVSLDEVRQSITEHENYTARREPGATVSRETDRLAKEFGVWLFSHEQRQFFEDAKAVVNGKVWRVGSIGWVRAEAEKSQVIILCHIKVPYLWPHGEFQK